MKGKFSIEGQKLCILPGILKLLPRYFKAFARYLKAFALTGRLADCYYTQGDALG